MAVGPSLVSSFNSKKTAFAMLTTLCSIVFQGLGNFSSSFLIGSNPELQGYIVASMQLMMLHLPCSLSSSDSLTLGIAPALWDFFLAVFIDSQLPYGKHSTSCNAFLCGSNNFVNPDADF
jgi:hypothetical protein